MKDFYVYLHIRKDTNEVFYIGKGRNKRAYRPYNRNNHWHNIVNKTGYKVEIFLSSLSEEKAFTEERNLIALFKRNPNNKLVNQNDGGTGNAGRKLSKEHIDAIKKANTGRLVTEKTRLKCSNTFKGKHHTKESKEKIRQARLGMSPSNKGKKGPPSPFKKQIICIDTGVTYNSIIEAANILGLNHSNISGVLTGKLKTTGKLRFIYKELKKK